MENFMKTIRLTFFSYDTLLCDTSPLCANCMRKLNNKAVFCSHSLKYEKKMALRKIANVPLLWICRIQWYCAQIAPSRKSGFGNVK